MRLPRSLSGLPREVGVLAAIAFCVALGFGILIPALPVFARTFNVSIFEASMVISAFALVRLLTAPLAGSLVNRLGERWVLSAGLLIVAISSAAAGLSQSFVQLLVLRGVGGLGSTMFSVSAMALLLRVVDEGNRARATSAYQGGFLIGGVAGPAVGGLVIAWSVRAPFFVYAITLLAATAVAVVFLRTPSRSPVVATSGTSADQASPSRGPRLEELREALRLPAYRAALSVNAMAGFVLFGMRTALIPIFVTEALHQSASLAGVGFLLAAGSQAVLLLPAGRLADTRGRRLAMTIGVSALLVGMLLVVAADVTSDDLTGSTLPGLSLFLVAMAVQGIASAFLGSSPAAVVGDVLGGRRGGIVVAAFQMVGDLGTVIGPLVAGLLVDQFDFRWAFAAAAALAGGVVILVRRMPETLRTPTTDRTGATRDDLAS